MLLRKLARPGCGAAVKGFVSTVATVNTGIEPAEYGELFPVFCDFLK